MIHFRNLTTAWLFLRCATCLAQHTTSTPLPRDPKLPVLKATEPIEILGTVIAHDRDGGFALGSVDSDEFIDVLVIRVEKQLKGKVQDGYVRADFSGGGGNRLPAPLFEGKQWTMKLEPARWGYRPACDWTIPPEPPVGDLLRDFHIGFRLEPVGGAKYIPDVNALQCYALERQALQEMDATRTR